MWRACWNQASLNMAAIGSTLVTSPLTTLNPAGLFIQALAATTKIPEAAPLIATGIPDSQ